MIGQVLYMAALLGLAVATARFVLRAATWAGYYLPEREEDER